MHGYLVWCPIMMMILFILFRSTLASQLYMKMVFCMQYLFRKITLFLKNKDCPWTVLSYLENLSNYKYYSFCNYILTINAYCIIFMSDTVRSSLIYYLSKCLNLSICNSSSNLILKLSFIVNIYFQF